MRPSRQFTVAPAAATPASNAFPRRQATLVKVCGLRSFAEARVALDAGANYLGFIFWQPGKRYVSPTDAAAIIRALRATSSTHFSAVGVFVDPTLAEINTALSVCDLDVIQLSGDESTDFVRALPRPTVKAIHVRPGSESHAAELVQRDAFGAHHYLLDTHADGLPGGTGVTFNWAALETIGPRCIVAGGLRAENVAAALSVLRPLGVDVSSGVEFPSGGKDPTLIRAFLEAVRAHDNRDHQ
jgi:phosphoribosylanthranilate isomerase